MVERNTGGTKGRVLFLRKYLEEHTDDTHYITTEELVKLYRDNGYKAQRLTIADDVAILSASGFEIITEQIARNHTKTNAYHVGTRLFEVAELKLLVDAVSSSRFITAEKSQLLISKLSQLTNEQNRSSLVSRIFTAERLKTSNTNILVNIDVVYKAIQDGKKVSFYYWDYSPTKEKQFRHNGEQYIVSPYALVWDDDRYYMPSYSDKYNRVVKFRVDRMCYVTELDEDAYNDPSFNIAEYTRKMIQMYENGMTEEHIILRCQNFVMQNVLDRFGEDTKTSVIDEDTFQAEIRVIPSSTFFSWILQFNGAMLIEAPSSVRNDFENLMDRILSEQRNMSEVIKVER